MAKDKGIIFFCFGLLPFALCLILFFYTGAERNIYEIVSDAQYKAAARFQVPVELPNAIKQVESN